MSDPPRHDTRFDTPQASAVRQQLAHGKFNRGELQPPVEKPKPRERLFSRKVLIGWALATLAIYFVVQVAKNVIKQSVEQAAVYTTGVETTPDQRNVIYTSPNGKFTITKDRKNGQITFSRTRPGERPANMTIPAPNVTVTFPPPAAPQPAKTPPPAAATKR